MAQDQSNGNANTTAGISKLTTNPPQFIQIGASLPATNGNIPGNMFHNISINNNGFTVENRTPTIQPPPYHNQTTNLTNINQLNHLRNVRLHNKAMLLKRLENGSNLCNYTHRICLQNKLEGFDHCIRHILYDKNAAFKQCSFVHPQSHKRCPNAARKTERKDAVCPWHIKKFFLKRKQLQLSLEEKSLTKTNPTQQIFKGLEQYCPNPNHDKNRLTSLWIKQEDDSITASDYLRRKIAESKNILVDSDSEDDSNNPFTEDTFRSDLIDSDSESIDSDLEEPLKHAGIYTAEEVSLILRDKMLRLQSLYISEFKYLQYLLKEKHKKYIQDLRNEREICRFDPYPFSNSNVKSEDYQKLKAMMKYHRYHGSEALLKKKAKEKKRLSTQSPTSTIQSEANKKNVVKQTCIYEKDDEKCTNRAMPLTHYCKNHILFDVDQVLFRPCASGDPPCLNPVMSFQKGNVCILHEEQKEIKDLEHFLEEENKVNNLSEVNNIPDSDIFQSTNDEISAMDIDNVAAVPLFGLDEFNQLDLLDKK